MGKIFKIAFIFSIVSQSVFGATPAPTAEKPLSPADRKIFETKMHNAVAATKTIQMTVTQKRVLKVFMDELTAKGVFYFQLPGKLRWETTTPYRTVLIYNDKHVAKFNFENNQWRKMEFGAADIMSEVMSNILDWTTGKFENAEANYELAVFAGYKIVLKPRSKDMAKTLNAIDLHIDPKTFQVKRVVLNEPKGDYVEITFSDPKENIKFDDKIFDLKSPTL